MRRSTITDSELACCSTQLTPHTGGGGHQRYYGGVSPLPSSEHPSSRRTDDEDGVSRMGSEEVNGDRRESGERDRESNISTEFLCVSGEFPRAEEHREQSAGGFQNSWEWREGRLLVYELVLGHLVKVYSIAYSIPAVVLCGVVLYFCRPVLLVCNIWA